MSTVDAQLSIVDTDITVHQLLKIMLEQSAMSSALVFPNANVTMHSVILPHELSSDFAKAVTAFIQANAGRIE